MIKKSKLLAILLSSTIAFTSITIYADENSKLKDKNKETQKKIEKINKEVDETNKEIKNSKNTVEKLTAKIVDITKKIADAQTKLLKLTKQLENSKKELLLAQEKEQEMFDTMKLRIQYMYENSNNNLLVMFLANNNFKDFLNGAEYKSEITTYDRKQLNKYIAIKNDVKLKKEKNEKLVSSQKALREKLKSDREESKVYMKQHEELIAKDKDKVKKLKETTDKLKKEIDERNALIKKNIEAQKAKIAAMKRGQGIGKVSVTSGKIYPSGYIWPLPAGYSTITSPFDPNRRLVAVDAIAGGHLGTDIGAPTGTPIFSARPGVVVIAGWTLGGGGNVVSVLQDDGILASYCHMSSVASSVGQIVSQGQVIGYVGATGAALGAHLHFQLQTDPSVPFGSSSFDPMTMY